MKHCISRRTFIETAALAGAALAGSWASAVAVEVKGAPAPPKTAMPVIDSHIHLYDPFRPQGVPWPGKDNPKLYQTSLPARYRPIAEPLGIVGAIEVECSGWAEDNQWVLDVAAREDVMVGTIGHLDPGTPEFRPRLDRLCQNPLFRGIRYGLGRQSGRELERPEFLADLQSLADADRVLDTANPSLALLADVARISQLIPHLRVVIDHLPQMPLPTEPAARVAYATAMKTLRQQPQIYVKVSEVLRRVNGNIPIDLEFYRPRLDQIMEVFGTDRVLYGSDWPNSDQWLPVPDGFKLVRDYFNGLGQLAAEKYFWQNSIHCYKWIRRTTRQPKLI